MQTRNVTQILIYKLFLNDAKFNIADLAGISFESDKLSDWMNSFKVDEYFEDEDMSDPLIESDEKVMISIKRSFIKDSPLYNYNMDETSGQKLGISTQWINEEDFAKFRSEYPTITILE